MPAQKKTATSVFGAIAGTLGFSALAGLLVTIMVAPAIAVTGVTANSTIGIFEALPDYIELDSGSQQNELFALNADGTEFPIATLYHQNRIELPLDEISEYLIWAAIDGEDRRFYDHGGVDVPSLLRAVIGQLTGDDTAGGASTLTMQTVRNIIQQEALNDDSLTPEQQKAAIEAALAPTLERKLKEMKLAIGLEKAYSKKQILQGYLNIAGFGGNTYGVQAAAQQYFSKNASEVTIAEAASLLAIVQEPSARNLKFEENFAANQERRDVILTAMFTEGHITRDELDEALAIPVDAEFVNYSAPEGGCLAATDRFEFVCDYASRVIDELDSLGSTVEERKANWKAGGYRLQLSVDPALQNVAWATIAQWVPANENRFQLGAAASSVQLGTGRIITMAQNKTFDNQQVPDDPATSTAVNFASDLAHGGSVGFQPGSTYKPFVLLAFLAAGHGVNESFNAGLLEVNQASFFDSCGGPWGGPFEFRNDAGENGSYTVMRGTAASVNSVFIQMASKIDQCEIKKLAESIGVHNASGEELSSEPSCSIGGCSNNVDPITQAAAYAAIANGGVYCRPVIIDKVFDRTGEELPGQSANCGQSLVAPNVANTAAYAMQSVMSGTAAASNPNDGTPYIGKTGTTDESVHTWMVGSSRAVSTAVWVGNISGDQALRNIRVNGTQAAVLRHRIFRPIAIAIDARFPGGAFPAPDPALLTGTPVFVPDNLLGLTPEQAKAAIELVELVYEDGGQVDSDLPEGTVAATNPAPGTSVPRGTTVKVYTSNGQASEVPDVIGMTVPQATNELDDKGFENVDTQCVDADDLGNPPPGDLPAPGTVAIQDPAAGAVLNRNTTILLSVYQNSCPP
jgi:membrane peptidoglycan carboxypeptidase